MLSNASRVTLRNDQREWSDCAKHVLTHLPLLVAALWTQVMRQSRPQIRLTVIAKRGCQIWPSQQYRPFMTVGSGCEAKEGSGLPSVASACTCRRHNALASRFSTRTTRSVPCVSYQRINDELDINTNYRTVFSMKVRVRRETFRKGHLLISSNGSVTFLE